MSKKLYAVVLDKKEISADLTLNEFALAVCENKRDAKNKLEHIYNIAKRKLLRLGVKHIAKNRYSIKEFVVEEPKQDTKWQKLKEFITNRPYYAGYDVQTKVVLDILDKMQELEKD